MAKTFVALDWDHQELRFVEGSCRPSGVSVRRAGAAEFPDGLWDQGAEAVGRFVADVLRNHRVRCAQAVACVPRTRGILKDIVFPSVDPDEVAGVVHFQAVKDLSFPPDEAVLDFALAATDQDGQSAALVAAVRNDVIDEYQQTAASANLKLVCLGLRSHANLSALTACSPEVSQSSDPALMIELGAELVEISVVCRGRLLFSRATSLGGPALRTAADTGTLEFLPEEERREARQSYRSLCNEVNRCVQAYQAQPGQPQVAQAYVLTSGDEHAGLADRLREATGLTVHRVSVFETLSGESEPPASQGSLSAALGLILEQDHPQGVPFDFLNPKKPKVVRDRRPLVLTLVVAAVAMAVATGLILFLNAKSRRQARLAHLTKRLGGRKGRTWSGLRKKLRDYHGLQARLDVVERWAGHRTNWLNELQALTDLFPPTDQVYIETCSLRQLKLPKLKRRARRSAKAGRSRQPKTPVASALLKGRARSRVLVDQLLRSAIATGRCRARPGGTQPRVDETPYRCRFSFSLDLLPPSVVQTQPSRGAATRPNAAKKADRKLQQRWGGSARAAAATGRELVTR